MDEYIEQNKERWEELTPIHEHSEFYDIQGFRNGKCHLKTTELEEIGNVSGKSLLHIQCHFGLDTLSWARRGAKVTGTDFSEKSIELARSLSEDLGIESQFICCNIYDLPERLEGEFDIIFTSYGVLCWLPDLKLWAEIIYHFLKPGGFFYIVEGHPFGWVFDDSKDSAELSVKYSYFHSPEPDKWEDDDYTESNVKVNHPSYEWTHSLGDIINALINAGLKIEFIHEFPYITWRQLPFMKRDKNGLWRIEGDKVPLLFSLKATKEMS